MVIKKISFVEAGSFGFQMLSRFAMPRVGSVLLSTILRERGYEVKAFIEDTAAIDWSFIENSDLVCISALTATAYRGYFIAGKARELGIPVIIGGVHASFLPEEALHYADFVVRGEGEYTLLELINALKKNRSFNNIPGLSFKDKDGRIVHNPPRTFLGEKELDKLPIPDFTLVHKWKSSAFYPISTSRGCPFDCKFCSVVPMFGRKYRFKSIEMVLKEMRYAHSVSRGVRFFVDDNFAANKYRTKELLKLMIAEKLTTRWVTQVRADVGNDPELLALMAEAGCSTLYIGFESINPKTLEAFNKKQDLDDILRCIQTVKDQGIRIHGMFVLGADSDSLDVIKNTVDFAIDSGIDTTQFVALTPLPGTSIFDEMKTSHRLLHMDWSKYNLQHVVFRPAQMSPHSLQLETLKGMGRFYSWKFILEHLAKFEMRKVITGIAGKHIVNSTMREVLPYLKTIRAVDQVAY